MIICRFKFFASSPLLVRAHCLDPMCRCIDIQLFIYMLGTKMYAPAPRNWPRPGQQTHWRIQFLGVYACFLKLEIHAGDYKLPRGNI
jgi:hypothetical protein